MHRSAMTSVGSVATLFLAFGTTYLHATLVANHPTNYFGGYYSQNDTSVGGAGNYATVYDNFTLASTDTILSVYWVGSYQSPAVAG